ncbi:MAG: pyroglutamyl-peptidase I [Pseudomonadota bacterium]|jgi:pyroglutamyl-peptidase
MPVERHRASRVVLLTGFGPFGGEARNPSWEAVRGLRGARIGGHAVAVARVPTAFARCAVALARAVARHRPVLVLCTGLALGRAAVSLERVAINCIDARIPDNDAARPIDAPVVAGAPAAYFARLPLKAMLAAIRARGIPAEVSNSAGTFVCNALAFHLAHGIATRWPGLRGGFVHLPAAPFQVADRPGTPSMALASMQEALRAAVAAALAHADDIGLGAGAEH